MTHFDPTPTSRLTSKFWLLAVLLVSPFMAQADATIANVATPSIHAHLGASGAALELVIGGYLVAFAVLLITGARLGETYGYRRLYVTGMAAFAAASLLCGLAPSTGVLVGARVLQGAAAALMFPQTLTGIQLNFSGASRLRAIGMYAIALSVGAVVGQILGGVLVSANIAGSHWRAIFLINVPIGLITLLAAARWLPKDEPHGTRRLDIAGVAALSLTVLLVVLPLTLGRVEGWPAWTWACLAGAVPALGLFLGIERRETARERSPLLNVRILARPTVAWALLTLFVATGTYYALLFTLAQYLQLGLGRSVLVSGLTLVPWVAAFGVAGQIVGRLGPRFACSLPTAGCLLLAAAYTAISALSFAGDNSELPLLGLLAAGGLGLGIQFSSVIGHLTDAVPTNYAADISGVSSTTAQIGGALGVAAFGTVYLGVAHTGAANATHAFALTSAAFAAAALLAAATSQRAMSPTAARTARTRTGAPAPRAT